MTMDLRSEALYLLRTLGTFLVPEGNLELGLLLPAIAPLTHAKVSVRCFDVPYCSMCSVTYFQPLF